MTYKPANCSESQIRRHTILRGKGVGREEQTIFMQMPGCETVLTRTVTTLAPFWGERVEGQTIFMQMPGRGIILTMISCNHYRQNGLTTRHLHENRPSLPIPIKTVWRWIWDSRQFAGFWLWWGRAEVAKYERLMWKILVELEKFAKVSESLITFLLKLEKNCWKFVLILHSTWSHAVRFNQVHLTARSQTISD